MFSMSMYMVSTKGQIEDMVNYRVVLCETKHSSLKLCFSLSLFSPHRMPLIAKICIENASRNQALLFVLQMLPICTRQDLMILVCFHLATSVAITKARTHETLSTRDNTFQIWRIQDYRIGFGLQI